MPSRPLRTLAARLRRGGRGGEPPGDSVARLATLNTRIAASPRLDDAGWRALRADVGEAVASMDDGDWLRLRLHQRLAAWLVAQDRRDDLTAALVERSEHGASFATRVDGGRVVALPGYLGAMSAAVPEWLLVPHPRDLALVARLEATPVEGGFRLRGHAYIAGLPGGSVRLWAADGDARRPLDVAPAPAPYVDAESGDRWNSYAEAGIEGFVERLPMRVQVEVTAAGGAVVRERYVEVAPPPADAVLLTGVRVDSAELRAELRAELWFDTASGPVPLPVPAGGDRRLSGDRRLETAGGAALVAAPDVDLDAEWLVDRMAVRLVVEGGSLVARVRSPLPLEARGRLAQRALIADVEAGPLPVQQAVLATCFGGRGAGDSVVPVARELARRHAGLTLRFGVADFSTPVPEGFEPVLLHSREWHEALRTSRWLVNNAHFPAYFRKRPGQTYVQTWHGTPLKRIGRDMATDALSLSYRATMEREAAAWDVLLAQSDEAGRLIAGALGYEGPVIATGYPRNDLLRAADATQRRAQVRAALGLHDDQVAVLYAPTWRDDAPAGGGRSRLVGHLAPEVLRVRLGDRYVVLIRGHANTRGTGDAAAPGGIDVSGWGDVAELMLAADVLVTDYSSVMFDFCATGRPIVLLVPDLAHYRDDTRGFYADLEQIAPGPLVSTTEQLADYFADYAADPAALTARYAERYAAFVARYAPHDDGHATVRVVDAIEALPR